MWLHMGTKKARSKIMPKVQGGLQAHPANHDNTEIQVKVAQSHEPWMLVTGFSDADQVVADALNERLLSNGIAASIVIRLPEASILIHGQNTGTLLHSIMSKHGWGLQDVILVHPSQVRSDRPDRAYISCLFIKGGKDMTPESVARAFNPHWLLNLPNLSLTSQIDYMLERALDG